MASVKQKQRKDDSIFFEISVSRGHGLSPYTMRWDRPEGLAGKTVKARLQAVASEFERDCRDGRVKTRKERKAEQEEINVKPKNDYTSTTSLQSPKGTTTSSSQQRQRRC